MNLKENWKVLTSKSVGNGTSSYEKSIYRAAVSQRLRNTVLGHLMSFSFSVALRPYSGSWAPLTGLRDHSSPPSVELLWTSDQPEAEVST